ncbi:MAG TPA: hypothetical protein VLL98_04160 [Rickettsiales bacterium]|nr:hypothetical protein [Rickettsiales bacterium]
MQENKKIAIFGKSGASIMIALLRHVFYKVYAGEFNKNKMIESFDDKNINSLKIEHFNDIICLDLDYSKQDIEKIENLIFKQSEKNILILNIDNEEIKEIYHSLKNNENCKSKIVTISTKKLQKDGASFVGNEIYFDNKQYLMDEFKNLTGEQNKINILASLVLLISNGLNGSEVIENFYSFKNIDDIFETISHKNNFTFINDIKNKNKLQSLKSFENIYWILCSNEIKFEFHKFKELEEAFKNIKYIFLLGEYSDEMLEIFRENKIKYFIMYSMEEIFKKITELKKKEKMEEKINVVLSSLNDIEKNDFYQKCSTEFEKIIGKKND